MLVNIWELFNWLLGKNIQVSQMFPQQHKKSYEFWKLSKTNPIIIFDLLIFYNGMFTIFDSNRWDFSYWNL